MTAALSAMTSMVIFGALAALSLGATKSAYRWAALMAACWMLSELGRLP